jgi:parallel beta-helix repeat protein
MSITITKNYVVVLAILTVSILLGESRTAFAQTSDSCLASIDPLTEEQTNPNCPAPESSSASVTAVIAQTMHLDSTCRFPAIAKGGQCVLERNVTLGATLDITSFTQLNCQGHTISPSLEGTGTGNTQRSLPEVAFLLREAHGVKIQNCIIDGFDFGIIVLKSKTPRQYMDDPGTLSHLQNNILENTINARFVPINLIFVDNAHIAGNVLTYNRNGGAGVLVQRDSDINQITNNQITGNLSQSGAVRVPGPIGPSNPVFTAGGAAVVIEQIGGTEPVLLNAVIENSLYQIDVTSSLAPNEDFTADNLVEGNTINFVQGDNDGIVLALPQRTIVRDNTIRNATNGMRAGIQTGPSGFPRLFPGSCSLDASRLCLSNADCNIPGIDLNSQGTCIQPPTKNVFWFSNDTTMQNNQILSPFTNGITLAGMNNILLGNTISGPTRPGLPAPGGVGITLLGKFAAETTVVTGNTITDVTNALRLDKVFQSTASAFGSRVSLNAFTGYTAAVRTSTDYNLPSELSVGQCSLDATRTCSTNSECNSAGKGACTNLLGNYWGLACPGFDAAKVLFTDGAVNASVMDSHPFGKSSLKTPCY